MAARRRKTRKPGRAARSPKPKPVDGRQSASAADDENDLDFGLPLRTVLVKPENQLQVSECATICRLPLRDDRNARKPFL